MGALLKIDRLQVKNFRNLADVDVRLAKGSVVVGANKSGKSNLVHALRLVLDPNMSTSDRQLENEDFWDGLSDGSDNWNPMRAGQVITASVEITHILEDDRRDDLLAVLGDALIEEEPIRARLTYKFAPVAGSYITVGGEQIPRYRGYIYGGDDEENVIYGDLRGQLHLVYLHALRDVADDIRSWRRSPLRALLRAAAEAATPEELDFARNTVRESNESIGSIESIVQLGEGISQRTSEMVGDEQGLLARLALASQDPIRLIRDMRLFVDGAAERPLHSSSLGTLNVLYLALLELGLEQRLSSADIAHVITAIEEPEAHLHPHLQRLVFGKFLRAAEAETTLLTTHSPHIASIANPRSLVALRSAASETLAYSSGNANLTDEEWDDIGRYLDATRAELVFASRVLLVEGFAEQVLAPAFANSLGLDLDKLGISVCSIHGTHFAPYTLFCEALGIPWAVVTDGDQNLSAARTGEARAARLIQRMNKQGTPTANGVFVGTTTLEYDLFAESTDNQRILADTLDSLATSGPVSEDIASWSLATPDRKAYMSVVNRAGGKGRLAQRLAASSLTPPSYFRDAISHLAEQ